MTRSPTYWLDFGRSTTSALSTEALSYAFQALSREQQAFSLYHEAITSDQERRHTSGSILARCLPPVSAACLTEYTIAANELCHAAESWSQVALALEQEVGMPQHTQQEEGDHRRGLRALVARALAERQRVTSLAQRVIGEQVALYRDAYHLHQHEQEEAYHA